MAIKQLILPCPYVAASGSMGPAGTGWHPLQKALFYPRLVPTTKTVTLEPRRGNSLLKAYRPIFGKQSCVNAMSLPNRGIVHLVNVVIPHLSKPSIVSVQAENADECSLICDVLKPVLYKNPVVLAIEVNLSCPNVGGLNKKIMMAILEEACDLPCPIIAKIGYQADYLELSIQAAESGLIDGIAAINSVPWNKLFSAETVSPLERSCGIKGGVSGKLIRQIALETTHSLRKDLTKIGKPEFPLISGGGISNGDDIREFLKAGASYISFGSALNMPNLWLQVWRALR